MLDSPVQPIVPTRACSVAGPVGALPTVSVTCSVARQMLLWEGEFSSHFSHITTSCRTLFHNEDIRKVALFSGRKHKIFGLPGVYLIKASWYVRGERQRCAALRTRKQSFIAVMALRQPPAWRHGGRARLCVRGTYELTSCPTTMQAPVHRVVDQLCGFQKAYWRMEWRGHKTNLAHRQRVLL